MSDDTRIYRKRGQSVMRRVAGETLLVPIRGRLADMQRIFALDPVAAHVWDRIDGRSSVREIVDSIVARFDVDRGTASADLEVFIGTLSSEGLIEGVGAGPAGPEGGPA